MDIQQQFKRMKRPTEQMYDSAGDVYGYVSGSGVINNTTKMLLYSQIPCRVSHSKASSSFQGDTNAVSKEIKLFLNPSYDIPSGSEIIVTQNGRTTKYESSGEAIIYVSHQEINLKLAKERA